jgi:hypothetical protein
MGMGVATVIVQCSLDKGRYAKHVQYETVRKICAVASYIYHSSIDGQGAMVMAKDTRKLQVTKLVPPTQISLNVSRRDCTSTWEA